MSTLCFIIHGIGTQGQNFSEQLQRGVHRELIQLVAAKKGDPASNKKWEMVNAGALVDFEPLYWANVGSAEQDNLYRRIYPDLFGTENRLKKLWQLFSQLAPVRSLSMTLLGDVFGYLGRFQQAIKSAVFSQLAKKLVPRLESGEPFSLILVGHSLGSVILHDLISGFLRYRYAGLDALAPRISVFTMGSPLSLFSLVAESADPSQFRKWVNFLHPRDPIAFPMSGVFTGVEDVPLSRLSWNPSKLHALYWHSATVRKAIAQEIIAHFEEGVITALAPQTPGAVPPEIFEPFSGVSARAGVSNYYPKFQDIPFAALIPHAREIDVCNVYGGSWLNRSAPSFVEALKRPDCLVRFCTLSPESASLAGFSHHFGGLPPDEIKKRIETGTLELRRALDEARREPGAHTGQLRIYRALNMINHSFYRFDDVIYLTPRPLGSSKLASTPIPTLVFRKTNPDDVFSWIKRDFDLMVGTTRDAVLYFDSAAPSPGESPST